MSASRIMLASLPSFYQKLSELVKIWRSSGRNNFAQFFETRCTKYLIKSLETKLCCFARLLCNWRLEEKLTVNAASERTRKANEFDWALLIKLLQTTQQ